MLTTNNGSPANTTVFNTTTSGTPVVTTSATGGTSDTLADVAEYYYITDLRDATLGNNIGVLGAMSPPTMCPAAVWIVLPSNT
jgi:hypothetical protein